MKQIRRSAVIVVMLIAALIVIGASAAFAQADGYSIDWFSTNSGGQSAGGEYTLDGVVGQAAAGELSGGAYTLTGGFLQAVDRQVYLPIVLR